MVCRKVIASPIVCHWSKFDIRGRLDLHQAVRKGYVLSSQGRQWKNKNIGHPMGHGYMITDATPSICKSEPGEDFFVGYGEICSLPQTPTGRLHFPAVWHGGLSFNKCWQVKISMQGCWSAQQLEEVQVIKPPLFKTCVWWLVCPR